MGEAQGPMAGGAGPLRPRRLQKGSCYKKAHHVRIKSNQDIWQFLIGLEAEPLKARINQQPDLRNLGLT